MKPNHKMAGWEVDTHNRSNLLNSNHKVKATYKRMSRKAERRTANKMVLDY